MYPGEEIGSAALRLRGYREALKEAGVPFGSAFVISSIIWYRNDGVVAMDTLLDSGVRPDGVMALDDMLASGMIYSTQMHGPRIPEDASVAGLGNSDDSRRLSPALTSIISGLGAAMRLSVHTLEDRVDRQSPLGNDSTDLIFRKVSPTLIVRSSTRTL